jgi:hypothetical protein
VVVWMDNEMEEESLKGGRDNRHRFHGRIDIRLVIVDLPKGFRGNISITHCKRSTRIGLVLVDCLGGKKRQNLHRAHLAALTPAI